MISTEDGPFDIFIRIRALLGVRYDAWGKPILNGTFARGISCLWCCSVWVGLVCAALSTPSLLLLIPLAFAYSAFSVVFDAVVRRLSGDRQGDG